MIFPSNILAIFNKHGGTQTPDDGVINVDPDLTVVAEVPEPVRMFTFATPSSDIQRTSGMWTKQSTVANGAINDSEIVILGPGLWDITVMGNYVSNYTDLTDFGEIYIDNGVGGIGASIWRIRAITNANDSFQTKFRLTVDIEAGIFINSALSANGAGQSHSLDANVFANRLG